MPAKQLSCVHCVCFGGVLLWCDTDLRLGSILLFFLLSCPAALGSLTLWLTQRWRLNYWSPQSTLIVEVHWPTLRDNGKELDRTMTRIGIWMFVRQLDKPTLAFWDDCLVVDRIMVMLVFLYDVNLHHTLREAILLLNRMVWANRIKEIDNYRYANISQEYFVLNLSYLSRSGTRP